MDTDKLDTLLYNGRIYTMEREDDVAEAVGMRDGKIAFVGSNEDAAKLGSRIRFDLQGATVIPGMSDSHMHMYAYCQNQTLVNLEHAESIDDLCAMMAEKAGQVPAGTWVKGVNFDQNKFREKKMPDRRDLDRISTVHPILIRRCCLHTVVVNSKALEVAGIDKDYQSPASGIVEKDREGQPNGVLREQATKIYDYIIPDPLSDSKTKDEVFQRVLQDMHKKGITSIHTYSAKIWNYVEDISYYRRLAEEGRLGVRITVCLDELFEPERLTEEERHDPNRIVQQGAYKLFTDGSLGARSAALFQPYADEPDNRGFMTCSQEELNEKIVTAYRMGLQSAIHAIGDRALDATLTAIENAVETLRGEGVSDEELAGRLPFRIIHVQIVNPELIKRMKALPVVLDIQPIFLATDWTWIEERLGKERLEGAYGWNTLQKEGFILTGGSDCPVESFDPIPGIYAAATRKGMDGSPEGGFLPEERLSRFDAAALYTRNPHFATGQQDVLGLIKEGYFADLAVLDRNIFDIEEDQLLQTKVTHTFIAGKLVHGTLSRE